MEKNESASPGPAVAVAPAPALHKIYQIPARIFQSRDGQGQTDGRIE